MEDGAKGSFPETNGAAGGSDQERGGAEPMEAGAAEGTVPSPQLERKTTLEKRVRESSGVSSSSGECTSGESRAADDDGAEDGKNRENEAGSLDRKSNDTAVAALALDSGAADAEDGDGPKKEGGAGAGAGATEGGKPKLPRPSGTVECPRCNSKDTKFCYYNNYNIKQPRYFCKVSSRGAPLRAEGPAHSHSLHPTHLEEKKCQREGSNPGPRKRKIKNTETLAFLSSLFLNSHLLAP